MVADGRRNPQQTIMSSQLKFDFLEKQGVSEEGIPRHIMTIPGGRVYITACDMTFANITVRIGDQSRFCSILVPSLRVESSSKGESLDMSTYENVLIVHRERILEKIKWLTENVKSGQG